MAMLLTVMSASSTPAMAPATAVLTEAAIGLASMSAVAAGRTMSAMLGTGSAIAATNCTAPAHTPVAAPPASAAHTSSIVASSPSSQLAPASITSQGASAAGLAPASSTVHVASSWSLRTMVPVVYWVCSTHVTVRVLVAAAHEGAQTVYAVASHLKVTTGGSAGSSTQQAAASVAASVPASTAVASATEILPSPHVTSSPGSSLPAHMPVTGGSVHSDGASDVASSPASLV